MQLTCLLAPLPSRRSPSLSPNESTQSGMMPRRKIGEPTACEKLGPVGSSQSMCVDDETRANFLTGQAAGQLICDATEAGMYETTELLD